MLAASRLLDQLQLFTHSLLGNPFCLYRGPAHPLRIHLQAPFRDRALTPLVVDFNKSMSTVRESVEWLFNDNIIATYFQFIDLNNNLKIGLSSVGKMYVVCSLLRNALTCLNGNQTSTFFVLDPLSPGISSHENLGSIAKAITLLQRYLKTKCSHQVFIVHLID